MELRELRSTVREATNAYLDFKNTEGTIVGDAKKKYYERKDAEANRALRYYAAGLMYEEVTDQHGTVTEDVRLYDK